MFQRPFLRLKETISCKTFQKVKTDILKILRKSHILFHISYGTQKNVKDIQTRN
jgi:hypothetical protein